MTGAAVEGTSAHTVFLLLAYSFGAAASLAVALLAGARAFSALKRSLGAERWIRRGLGIAVLAGVVAVALGFDRGVLTQLSLSASTTGVEQSLVDRLQRKPKEPAMMMMMSSTAPTKAEGPERLADLSGMVQWFNSPALNAEALKGRVVLIDFWTYSCINCLRTLPYITAWANRYKDSGLVVIGVHTPEFAFEKDPANVQRALTELKIPCPIALDNNYSVWKEFNNKYWPSDFLVDVNGKIRYRHFGEGKYEATERQIQVLLKERDGQLTFKDSLEVTGAGAQAPPDKDVQSPETYVGYERADSFMSAGGLRKDSAYRYTVPDHL